MPQDLTHIDSKGNPGMVDVSGKNITTRYAEARAVVEIGSEIINLLQDGEIKTKKGSVFQTAIIAGTGGAKNTSNLIPFCHPIGMDSCKIKM